MTVLPTPSSRPARRLAMRLATLVAAAALAAVPALVHAQPPQGGGGRGGMMQAQLFEGITLTAAQQTRIDAIRASFRPAGGARGQGGPGAGRPDSAAMAQRQQRMQAERQAIRAVLTADQQTTFDKNVQRLEERMRERMARLRREPVTPPRR